MSTFHFGREQRGFAGLFKPRSASRPAPARRELPRLTEIVPSDSLLDPDSAHDDAGHSTGFEITEPGELCTLSFGRSRFF
jgi:hypothetical protein